MVEHKTPESNKSDPIMSIETLSEKYQYTGISPTFLV
jgi:hypothetical protein